MVSDGRDLSRVAATLVAIGLRMVQSENEEENEDDPDRGLRPSVN
jgi:hypothetical protein